MSDFAGVDPHRVRALADRLKDLADVLEQQAPTIRRLFDEWHGTVNQSVLFQQVAQVRTDAHDMARRADLALKISHDTKFVDPNDPHKGWSTIPWDVSEINSAAEGKDEAAELAWAMDNPGEPQSRAIITEVGQSLADHLDDPAYLQAFMANGGMDQAARAARILHGQDGTHGGVVLSPGSEKILAQFGQGVQTATTLARQGKIQLPPDYLTKLTAPPGGDMWSVGMLFTYGPSGDQWDPGVLSSVGGAMLDWRAKQKTMRPSYTAADFPYTAGGYVGKDDGGWYHSIGLDPDYLSKGMDENGRIVQGISANDPALALMSRVAENAQAARDLLGQDTDAGRRYAQQLVDFRWQTPGPTTRDDSDPVSRVLTLAATDRSPDHQDQSGQAADNILTAAARMKDTFDARNGLEKDEYPTYPKATAVALAGITATWADDLGATSLTSSGSSHGYANHALGSNEADLIKVMQLFAKDNPGAAAMFDTALHEQVSEAAGSKDAVNDLTNMGNLAGIFTKAKVGINYTRAQQIDEDHKFNLALLNTAGTVFTWIPGPTAASGETLSVAAKAAAKGLKYSQNLVTLGRTVVAPQTDPFSVDNAAKQEALNKDEARDQFKNFSPAIAQGLIRSGAIPPPTGQSWYDPATGVVSPSPEQQNEFTTWWANVGVRAQYLNSFQSGFITSEGSLDGK